MIDSLNSFTYETLPIRVLFGPGYASGSVLAEEVKRLDAKRILLITSTRRRKETELLTLVIKDKIVGVYDQVRLHVPFGLVKQGCDTALQLQADCLLSVGGGSSTGMAKAIARDTGLPIICIPTTYAGSEMTPVWGITNNAIKKTGRSLKVLPKTVIYDVNLTMDLAKTISSPSAINALAHCIASVFASNGNPITSLIALEGISSLVAGVKDINKNLSDKKGRDRLLYGAYLAGSVFAITGSGVHHKFCHVLGGSYDLPHAELHSILLPYTTAILADVNPDLAKKIASTLAVDDLPESLYQLDRDIGIPVSLSDIGMDPSKLGEAVNLCFAAVPEYLNVSREKVHKLLNAALLGKSPREFSDHQP